MNDPYDAFFQNCINGSTPLNRRATRAPDKKSFIEIIQISSVVPKVWHFIVDVPKMHQSSRKRRIRHIFTPTFGFVRILFLLGILIYASFFLLTRLKLLKNTWRRQRETKFGFRHKRSEDRR